MFGGNMIRTALLITFIFTIGCFFCQDASASKKRIFNCEPTGTLNSCECDYEDDVVTGFVVLPCGKVACEQFSRRALPRDCRVGTRAVNCQLVHSQTNTFCGLWFPRVQSQTNANELCKTAVEDIAAWGAQSDFYNNLDPVLCRPSGYSSVPNYWTLLGVVEGAN
jgi:hypothetical protein